MYNQNHIIIVGSGISGLSLAIRLTELNNNLKILLLSKYDYIDCNTYYAQGGIAFTPSNNISNTEINSHIVDTIVASQYSSNLEVTDFIIRNSDFMIQKLISWGINFDQNSNGELDKILEAGHSLKRIVHCKDYIGKELQMKLLSYVKKLKNIRILKNISVIDLLYDYNLNLFYGVKTIYNNYIVNYYSNVIVLASGGIGNIYQKTTNSSSSDGQCIGMAIKHGVKVSGMNYIQFHPTGLYTRGNGQSFLISEALRGAGAKLINQKGEYFMAKYHKDKDLAPRDIVSRSIFNEMLINNEEYVYLDARHIEKYFLKSNFPTIYNTCLNLGIDISYNLIPICPVAHYFCGGIDVNINGQTNILNLYASGECARTGFHGANRLASNSLIEALVMSNSIAIDIITNIDKYFNLNFMSETIPNIKLINNINIYNECNYWKLYLKKIMTNYVGVIRCNKSLNLAYNKIIIIEKNIKKYNFYEIYDILNMIFLCKKIILQSMNQKYNLGTHYNKDNL